MGENYTVSPISNLLGFETEQEKVEFQKEILSLKFIKVIEQFMEQNNISRKVLGEKMGYSQAYISQVFNAYKPVNLDFLVKFQNTIDMSFEIKLAGYKQVQSPMDMAYNRRNDMMINSKFRKFYPVSEEDKQFSEERQA